MIAIVCTSIVCVTALLAELIWMTGTCQRGNDDGG